MSMTSGGGCGVRALNYNLYRPLPLLANPSPVIGGEHHVQVPFLRLRDSFNQQV